MTVSPIERSCFKVFCIIVNIVAYSSLSSILYTHFSVICAAVIHLFTAYVYIIFKFTAYLYCSCTCMYFIFFIVDTFDFTIQATVYNYSNNVRLLKIIVLHLFFK